MLGGYQPGGGPTHPMTSELLFTRILLRERKFTDEDVKEVSDFA
jgi:hypothetical protein